MKKIFASAFALLASALFFTACLQDVVTVLEVRFDPRGGTIAGEEAGVVRMVHINRGQLLGTLPAVTRDGYSFGVWRDGFTTVTANTMVNTDLVLFAHWTSVTPQETHTVTFNAPGSTMPTEVITVNRGSSLGPRFPVDPRQQGRAFSGWIVPELGDAVFTYTTPVEEDLVVIADWIQRERIEVEFHIRPLTHWQANYEAGFRLSSIFVYEGETIDEWEQRFPYEMFAADHPRPHQQFFYFFYWSIPIVEGGQIISDPAGLRIDGRTPITQDHVAATHGPRPNFVQLATHFGEYFYPRSFDVDLSTIGYRHNSRGQVVNNNDIVRRPPVPQIGMVDEAGNVILNPVGYAYDPETSSITVTFHASNAMVWFQTPPELRALLTYADTANETELRFEVEYEFEDPSREHPENHFNFMVANLRGGDNWNSSQVHEISLQQINYGWEPEDWEYEDRELGAVHEIVETINTTNGHNVGTHAGNNRDWILIRAGRGSDFEDRPAADRPFTVTFRSIRVHLLQ